MVCKNCGKQIKYEVLQLRNDFVMKRHEVFDILVHNNKDEA